jgi:hypothetical protein
MEPSRRYARRAVLLAVLSILPVAVLATPAAAHEVAPMPADNLVVNPWLSKAVGGQLVLDTTGWVFQGSPTWGTGNAKSDCPGPAPWNTSFTLRWARNAGQTPEFHPNIEVVAYTVVSANSSHRRLKFFMHWVMHRMTLKALVYGGSSPTGPWTRVWTPFQHTETVLWQSSPTEPRSEAWKHFTSMPGMFDDWFAPVPVTTLLAQGFGYYKIELRASYPDPDSTATGGVGGKLTGVYFNTAA